MIITLLRGITIDIDNIPDDFEKMIKKSFGEYTEETNKDYTYQDKLKYIDDTARRLHKAENDYDCVKNLLFTKFECDVDNGNIPDKEDYLSIEFMEECHHEGLNNQKMYSFRFAEERRDNEKIMKILCRIIKAVMEYEKGAII